jgi:hypothetical protein
MGSAAPARAAFGGVGRALCGLAVSVALAALAGCVREDRPEYHPEVRNELVQTVTYPTTVLVRSREGALSLGCPRGSAKEGLVCVRPAVVRYELRANGCPEGATEDAGACVGARVEARCPAGMHFRTAVGCVPDLPVSGRSESPRAHAIRSLDPGT